MLGFLDSPLWLDIQPLHSTTVSLQTQTEAIYALVNATGVITPACATAYAGEEWKCLYGQYRIPMLQTPYLINAAQFDRFQLPYNEGGMPPYSAQQNGYAMMFQKDVLAVVKARAPPPRARRLITHPHISLSHSLSSNPPSVRRPPKGGGGPRCVRAYTSSTAFERAWPRLMRLTRA